MSDTEKNTPKKEKKGRRSISKWWADIKEKKAFKILTKNYVIATFIFLVMIFFIDKNNVINWGRNYLKVVRQEKVIRQYEEDIRKTDDKLKELTSDKDSLEKFAREQYYFQEEGDEVFIVE